MESSLKIILSSVFMMMAFSSANSQTRNFQGDTQIEMNVNANNEYLASEEKMQKSLTEALLKHEGDSLLVTNLQKSQKQWEIWRDAEIEAFYPPYKDSIEFYGSMEPLCRYSKLIDWTEQRIKQLEIYSKDVQSDDACGPGKLL